jgi:hypothetical protein
VRANRLRTPEIDAIEENGKNLLVPSDLHRGYQCIIKYRGEGIIT